MELSTLGEHADQCKESSGRLFALRCAADAVHAFFAPRLITTLVILGLAIGIGSFVI